MHEISHRANAHEHITIIYVNAEIEVNNIVM